MNGEHKQQCEHIDHTIAKQVEELSKKIDYNNKITESAIQQISAVGSDLKSFKQEMKPWLEAKIGLHLLWRWGISIPIIVATILGIKTMLHWFGITISK